MFSYLCSEHHPTAYNILSNKKKKMRSLKQLITESFQQINESFKSTILSKLLASNPTDIKNKILRHIKNMYTSANIALHEITDDDIIELRGKDIKNAMKGTFTDVICIFAKDNFDVLDMTDGKGQYISAINADATMSTHGHNGYKRRKYDETGFERNVIKYINREDFKYDFRIDTKQLFELTDVCYVLDLKSIKRKHDAVKLQNVRYDAKQGALAMTDVKQLIDENRARYQQLKNAAISKTGHEKTVENIMQIVNDALVDAMSSTIRNSRNVQVVKLHNGSVYYTALELSSLMQKAVALYAEIDATNYDEETWGYSKQQTQSKRAKAVKELNEIYSELKAGRHYRENGITDEYLSN